MENRRGREGWSRLFSGEKQEEHLALVSGVLWGFEHPIDNTPGTWKVVSNNLRATDRGYANFREIPKGEVRRIPIPRTPVNSSFYRCALRHHNGGMTAWRRITRRRWTAAAAALGLALVIAVVLGIFWFGQDWWKFLIGWKALVSYIDPQDATDRKDAVQVYTLIVAGVVATITATVGLINLLLTRASLEQQRVLEAKRGQGTALQAYYEQIGKLITDKDLLNTERKEIRELARGQTLTVLQEVDGKGKGILLTFLHGAGLIGAENPAVMLSGADLRHAYLLGANLPGANLYGAQLERADLRVADLRHAYLLGANLYGADLREAIFRGAKLPGADLREANLYGADLPRADLQGARGVDNQRLDRDAQSLEDAIMPNGQKYEDWRKDEESRKKDA
jgi:uncharacterized protein YjbI with pentapeptide repeats